MVRSQEVLEEHNLIGSIMLQTCYLFIRLQVLVIMVRRLMVLAFIRIFLFWILHISKGLFRCLGEVA